VIAASLGNLQQAPCRRLPVRLGILQGGIQQCLLDSVDPDRLAELEA
jgi:hypothetical protein